MAGKPARRLRLPRGADAPALLWSAIESAAPLAGADAETRFRIELGLTEVLTNILRHSGGCEAITVRIGARREVLTVLVVSDGRRFDMSRAEAQLPTELLAEGGRGLFLIRECVDRLRYRQYRDWNLHRLRFDCPQAGCTD